MLSNYSIGKNIQASLKKTPFLKSQILSVQFLEKFTSVMKLFSDSLHC